jgi:hypothetical protein
MKRYILLALMLFLDLTQDAMASGKLSMEWSYYPKIEIAKPKFGFSIYENLFLGVAYNSWTGFGWQPRPGEASVLWASSRHDLERWWGNLGVQAGFTYKHAEQPLVFEDSNQHDVHAKLIYKLW